MRVDPGGGSGIGPVPHDQPIDQAKVTKAVEEAQQAAPMSQSALARVLSDPTLNQAERDQVIQDLARDDSALGTGLSSFFAHDVIRRGQGDMASLNTDENVIADAVQQAYADGAINTNDLMHIADSNKLPGGAGGTTRFMQVLMQGATANEPGSAAEALANGLWDRNKGDDRVAASMEYTSSSMLMQKDLNTPARRQEAFEKLVNFNDSQPYSQLPSSALTTAWQNQGIKAEANLFAAYGPEMVHDFARPNASTGDMAMLSKFMSQTMFNPNAQDLVLYNSAPLKSALANSMGNVSGSLLQTMAQAPTGSRQSNDAVQEFSQFSATMTAGVELSLTKYDAQINANAAARQQWATMVGQVAGAAAGQIPGYSAATKFSPVGNPAQAITSAMVAHLINIKDPTRPKVDPAITLHDQYHNFVNTLKDGNLTGSWDGTYAATKGDLETYLNINPGGHQN